MGTTRVRRTNVKTAYLPRTRCEPGWLDRVISARYETESLSDLVRVALDAEVARRLKPRKSATLDGAKAPHSQPFETVGQSAEVTE